MNFPEVIRSCHDSISIVRSPTGNPAVYCRECRQVTIADVYDHVRSLSELSEASRVAQSYAVFSNDYDIPVTFALVGLKGILDKRVEGQTLRRLLTCIKLFKALNSPFTENASFENSTPEMDNFLIDYISVIGKHQENLKTNELSVLNHLLQNLHRVLDNKDFNENKLNFYFEKLVPYVKTCSDGEWTILPEDDNDTNVVMQLSKQLHRSEAIREMLGKYCVYFDLFHVLVACYACCVDVECVANWALDVIAKMCRGNYFWKSYQTCPSVVRIRTVLRTEFTYKRNTDLYYMLREMQKGNGIESLSANISKFAQLEQIVREKIQAPPEIKEMLANQLFPAVVFETPWDQLAFTIAISHVSTNVDRKTGQIKKGTFVKARKLSNVVSKLVKQVHDFDEGSQIPWTTDTLKLFLISDPTMERNLAEIAEIVFQSEED